MTFPEFVQKAAVEHKEYVTQIDYNNEMINIFFDDGTRADFKFDEWFYMLEASFQIVQINADLNIDKTMEKE